tara:strand:+ start:704 stop:2191 length:1488 start_codon:yes stop_codon:yes gene_type:complete
MASNTSDFFTFSKTAGTAKNLQKPTDGGDNNLWGQFINVNLDTIIGAVNATSDLIADANQNELVDFTATESAVNHVGIKNAATGNGPTIEAAGDDTNIDLNVSGKGTGALTSTGAKLTSPKVITGVNDTNGNELIKVTATGSAVNEITVANAPTGNGPTLSATGDDTNIDLNIAGKGSGTAKFTSNIIIPDAGNVGSVSDPDAISIASDGNISLGSGIVSGNFGTITQRSASSSSPTFSESNGTTINKTNLYGTTPIPVGSSSTHAWIAWDYGAGVARKITKFQAVMQGQSNSTGVFLEGSNVDSPNTLTGNSGSGNNDWTLLKSLGNIINDAVISYSSPVTATTLKYRHYRLRLSWSSNNGANITKFVLEDTDSTFDARTALNATGAAPMYACRAFVNFDGNSSPLAIRASGNVSSVTDRGTGLYTVNITTAFPDSNYTVVGMSGGSGSSQNAGVTQENINSSLPSTSAIPLVVRIRNTSADGNSAFVCIACFS